MEKNEPKYMNSNLIFILNIQSVQSSSDKGLELLGIEIKSHPKELESNYTENKNSATAYSRSKLDSYQ